MLDTTPRPEEMKSEDVIVVSSRGIEIRVDDPLEAKHDERGSARHSTKRDRTVGEEDEPTKNLLQESGDTDADKYVESVDEDCEVDDPEMHTSQTYVSNRGTGLVKRLTKERTIEMQQRRAAKALQLVGLNNLAVNDSNISGTGIMLHS